MSGPRIIAVDWSGAVRGAHRKIAVAEIADGALSLHAGLDRDGVSALLADRARHGRDVIAGLDFAFSAPAWFLRPCGWSAPDLWRKAADGLAESWLMMCEPPFWGRPGRRRPAGGGQFRRTDLAIEAVAGIRPKPVFQIAGAGSVGCGSLRGWPMLHELRRTEARIAGYAVWPFDAPNGPLLLEVWPRVFTGAVRKSDAAARTSHLDQHARDLAPAVHAACVASEDAFDAVLTARGMWEHRAALASLPAVENDELRTEGIIWRPAWRAEEA